MQSALERRSLLLEIMCKRRHDSQTVFTQSGFIEIKLQKEFDSKCSK